MGKSRIEHMADWFMPAERPSYLPPPLFHSTQRLRLTNLIDVWQPPILRMWTGLKMTDKPQESRKSMSSRQEERGGAGGWQLTEVTDGDTQTRHTTFCQGHWGSLCRRHLRLWTFWIQWELSRLEKSWTSSNSPSTKFDSCHCRSPGVKRSPEKQLCWLRRIPMSPDR